MQDKSEQDKKRQKLFERIRHVVSSQHQVMAHLTEWELNEVLAMLTKEPIKHGVAQ